MATGKKTLTLIEFEERYRDSFIAFAEKKKDCNLWQCYLKLTAEEQRNPKIIAALKQNDINNSK